MAYDDGHKWLIDEENDTRDRFYGYLHKFTTMSSRGQRFVVQWRTARVKWERPCLRPCKRRRVMPTDTVNRARAMSMTGILIKGNSENIFMI